jgi:hypothetical protein
MASPDKPAPALDPGPKLNLPGNLRLGMYIATSVISLIITYGVAKGWSFLGDAELALWAGIVALINTVAALNVRTGT